MKEYIDMRNEEDFSKIKTAAKVIVEGGLVLFPTETVYGIGASGLDANAIKKIYKAKNRDSDNPLILHISNMDMLDIIAKDITELEYKLMSAFFPGPFTIILKKKNIVPDIATGGLDTVAVRMPSNKIANKLIEYADVPIAAPSANISGRPSGTCIEDIYEELKDNIDVVIDGGKCLVGIESTVVKVDNSTVKILRPGKITKEQIEEVVASVELDSHIFSNLKEGEKVLSPGMKYKHYAPKSKCMLVYSDNNLKMIKKINELVDEEKKENNENIENCIVICSDENKDSYTKCKVLTYGKKESLEEISSNIFTLLRKVDSYNSSLVIIEGVKKQGLGLAIMNRLIRACSHEYMEL